MVERLAETIPPEFFEGIAEVVVSPRVVSHPERADIWTLGECIPLPSEPSDPRYLQSRVVLYHGSFQALAHQNPDFDWESEAWETLTHELRHHVEWKAREPALEALDRAAEANYARQDGEPFDPQFYRDGLRLPDGSFQIEDDVFIERLAERPPELVRLSWGGEALEVPLPGDCTLPAFLTLLGVKHPPAGELVLVLQQRRGWLALLRRPAVYQAEVEARPLLK